MVYKEYHGQSMTCGVGLELDDVIEVNHRLNNAYTLIDQKYNINPFIRRHNSSFYFDRTISTKKNKNWEIKEDLEKMAIKKFRKVI